MNSSLKNMELKCEQDLLKMHLSLFMVIPVLCLLTFALLGYKFNYVGILAVIIAHVIFSVLNLIKCLEIGIRIKYLKAIIDIGKNNAVGN